MNDHIITKLARIGLSVILAKEQEKQSEVVPSRDKYQIGAPKPALKSHKAHEPMTELRGNLGNVLNALDGSKSDFYSNRDNQYRGLDDNLIYSVLRNYLSGRQSAAIIGGSEDNPRTMALINEIAPKGLPDFGNSKQGSLQKEAVNKKLLAGLAALLGIGGAAYAAKDTPIDLSGIGLGKPDSWTGYVGGAFDDLFGSKVNIPGTSMQVDPGRVRDRRLAQLGKITGILGGSAGSKPSTGEALAFLKRLTTDPGDGPPKSTKPSPSKLGPSTKKDYLSGLARAEAGGVDLGSILGGLGSALGGLFGKEPGTMGGAKDYPEMDREDMYSYLRDALISGEYK